MKLTQTCEHGTRTVEFDEGSEGDYAFTHMPRCPYCENGLAGLASRDVVLAALALNDPRATS